MAGSGLAPEGAGCVRAEKPDGGLGEGLVHLPGSRRYDPHIRDVAEIFELLLPSSYSTVAMGAIEGTNGVQGHKIDETSQVGEGRPRRQYSTKSGVPGSSLHS